MDKQSIFVKNVLVKIELVLDNEESRHKGARVMERSEQGSLVHPEKQNEDCSAIIRTAGVTNYNCRFPFDSSQRLCSMARHNSQLDALTGSGVGNKPLHFDRLRW